MDTIINFVYLFLLGFPALLLGLATIGLLLDDNFPTRSRYAGAAVGFFLTSALVFLLVGLWR